MRQEIVYGAVKRKISGGHRSWHGARKHPIPMGVPCLVPLAYGLTLWAARAWASPAERPSPEFTTISTSRIGIATRWYPAKTFVSPRLKINSTGSIQAAISSPMKRVRIYTDGACKGNPGPGGWAAVLLSGLHRKEISGREGQTTNNRMELRAAIEALRALREPTEVDLFTDSAYLKRGITEWLPRWKKNGWRRREGQRLLPVANEDLWRELDQLAQVHKVRFHWVAGHAGDAENERADRLASAAAEGR